MSLVPSTRPAQMCLQSIRSIEQWEQSPSSIHNRSTATIDRIASEENNRNWRTIDVNLFGGKAKPGGTNTGQTPEFFLEYETPDCHITAAPACPANVCAVTDTTSTRDNYVSINIDKCASKGFVLTDAEFDAICESPSERWAKELVSAARYIRSQQNNEALAALYANLGTYSDGSSPVGAANTKTVTIVTSDGVIFPQGIAKIRREFKEKFWTGDIQMVGGLETATYFDVREFSGVGSFPLAAAPGTAGPVDPFRNAPFSYERYLDSTVQGLETTTDSYLFAWANGAIGYQEWSEFTGYKEKSRENLLQTTIMIEGEMYDYSVFIPEGCDGEVKVLLQKNYAFPVIPEAAYCQAGGFVLMYKVACGSVDCTTLQP